MGLPLDDRHRELRKAADIARDAATAGLDACRPGTAVEWLEQERSVMWNQLSQLRTPADELRAAYPELADQFERVSHRLEHASPRKKPAMNKLMNRNAEDTSLEVQAREHRALALSREKLLAHIRSLPGIERFLLPKTIEQLTSSVHSGPVVFLNASKWRCDALIVIPGSDRVVHVPLPSITYEKVEQTQKRLGRLLEDHGLAIPCDGSSRAARRVRHDISPDEAFRSILSYLWQNVVNPVLEKLAPMVRGPAIDAIFYLY